SPLQALFALLLSFQHSPHPISCSTTLLPLLYPPSHPLHFSNPLIHSLSLSLSLHSSPPSPLSLLSLSPLLVTPLLLSLSLSLSLPSSPPSPISPLSLSPPLLSALSYLSYLSSSPS